MDLTDPEKLRQILYKHGAKPREGWGQNFLISKNVLNEIINTANIRKNDTVLEVGGGAGTLSQELASRAKEVTVIEKDPLLIPVLKDVLQKFSNINIVKADVLKLYPIPYTEQTIPWRIVANIPYWITGRFLRLVLECPNPANDIILMVQKEMAERICATAPHMNLLALSVQYFGKPKIIIDNIAPDNFWPASGVNSSVIKIRIAKIKRNTDYNSGFFRLARAGFAHPRKLLKSNLKDARVHNGEEIEKAFFACGLNKNARAQELSVRDWKCLIDKIGV